jgi:hypothetical protein
MIVGIDQQRRLAFDRRARETRQDQHAWILCVLRRDIFLGNQIHAVAKWSHQCGTRGAIEAGK